MSVMFGGGITMVNGSRSPPTRAERDASATKTPFASQCAYRWASPSVSSGDSVMAGVVIVQKGEARCGKVGDARRPRVARRKLTVVVLSRNERRAAIQAARRVVVLAREQRASACRIRGRFRIRDVVT